MKIGKMFVSASMVSFSNFLIAVVFFAGYVFVFQEEDYEGIILYIVPNILIRGSICYMSCLQMSKIQTTKTMMKILKSRNFNLAIS